MKKLSGGKDLFTIAISAMFLGGFLLLVLFGTSSYRRVDSLQEDTGSRRLVLSYLSTTLKTDRAAHITIEDKEGYHVLTLADEGDEYGKRIYLYEGKLVEDYGKLSGKLFPDDATVIAEEDVFEVLKEGDLLRIRTSEGDVLLEVKDRQVELR